MLACAYLFLEGTPFVYQGQEIGMTNISLPTIEDYPDCIAEANYRSYVGKMEEEGARPRAAGHARQRPHAHAMGRHPTTPALARTSRGLP